MIDFDEIKKYLPYYLNDESQDKLFQELKLFPGNIDARLYSTELAKDEIIYQGDGIDGLLVVNLPAEEIKPCRSMVISNSCDIYSRNKRLFSSRMIYAPIFNLEKYIQKIMFEYRNDAVEKGGIDEHIASIRKQLITQIFFLPKGSSLENDSIVFLDRLNNRPNDFMSVEDIKQRKIFTLSNYGFYLFIIKLSIHFTRVRESVERTLQTQ